MVDLNLQASSIICLNEAPIKITKVECNCDINKLVFGIVFKIVHDIMKNYAK
jgi:hypothetical protein